MNARLQNYRKAWNRKKILREVYFGWYREIIAELTPGNGKILEIGSGIGNFKEYNPGVVASDIVDNDGLDIRFDAHFMPFCDNSIANIVMIDVLHHLSNPVRFLNEALRVLKKEGRILLFEPYPTPVSSIVYRLFHREPFNPDVDFFGENSIKKKDPWEANQAAAFVLFFKQEGKFRETFGQRLHLVKKKLLSCILYPLSGGFEHKQLLPDFMIPVLKALETICTPLRALLAFRCFIILEKK